MKHSRVIYLSAICLGCFANLLSAQDAVVAPEVVQQTNAQLAAAVGQGSAQSATTRALLTTRHQQLIKVFRNTPEKARSYALAATTRAALLKADPTNAVLIERDTPLTGELTSLMADDFVHHTATKQYSLHTKFGDRALAFTSKRNDLDRMVHHQVTVTGLSIPEVVAAESLREASPAEVNALSPPAAANMAQPDASAANTPAASAAAATFTGPGVPPGSATAIEMALGPQTTAVLILKFAGNNVAYPTGLDQQAYYNKVFNGPAVPNIASFVNENSYTQTSVSADIYGPISVPGSFDCSTTDAMATAAVPAAAASGVDFTKYNHIVFVFPVATCYFGGLGSIDALSATTAIPHQFTYVWVPINTSYDAQGSYNFIWLATNHEFGHNLGLNHANSLDFGALSLGPLDYKAVTPGIVTPGGRAPESEVSAADETQVSAIATTPDVATIPSGATNITAVNTEYGDKFSDMGDGQGLFSAQHIFEFLGWIGKSGGQDITISGNFTLSPSEANAGLRALHVLRDPVSSSWVWVEFHQPIGIYQPLSMTVAPDNVPNTLYSGAQLHYQDGFGEQKHTLLMDMTPTGTPNNFFDGNLAPGASWSDPFSLLTITTGTQTTNSLGVSVSYDTPCATVALNTPSLPAAGGSGSVTLTAPGTCNWSVSSNASWVSFSGATSGSGNGAVTFTAMANTALVQRNTYITAQRQSLPLVQDGAGITVVSLVPAATTVAAGTSASVALNLSDAKGATADISQVNVTVAGNTNPDCVIAGVSNGTANSIDLYLNASGNYTFVGTSGTAGIFSTSSCTLDSSNSVYTAAGKLATLTLALSFPASFSGVHNVTASATDAQSSSTVPVGLFNITASNSNSSVAISPASIGTLTAAASNATVPFTITGSNTSFSPGTTIQMSGTGIAVSNIAIVNSSSITGNLVVDATAMPGSRTLAITSGNEVVTTLFTVNAPTAAITLSPGSGLKGQTIPVTITASHAKFTAGTTLAISGDRIAIKDIKFVNPTSITAKFVLDSDTASDTRVVTATTGSEMVSGTFTVLPDVTPYVQIVPATANVGDKTFVTITGTDSNFTTTSTLTFSGSDITVKDIAVLDPTRITADLVISNSAVAGTRTFTITTGTQVAKGTFTITSLIDTTTTITAAGPSGMSATLTAMVAPKKGSGTPDGFVSFIEQHGGGGFDDILATVPLSGGMASFVVSNLSAGVHTFSAQYLGDTTTYAQSVSSKGATITVTQGPSFTITPSPATETVTPGVFGAFVLQLQSVDGFDEDVMLTCSGGPAGAICKDFPMKVHLNGSALAVSAILFPAQSPLGSYLITFTGVSGSISSTADATFILN